jgi:Domain of unknown function (DUF1707)
VTTGPVEPAAGGRGRLRASDADRERVIEALKVAFVQERLTRGELDLRAGQAFCSRTYAELAAAAADIPPRPAVPARPVPARPVPARPVPARLVPAWPPPELPASGTARRPANHGGLKWALALATIALPIMIAEALATGSKDLFSGTTLALMAYILALRIALTNVVCARLEDDDPGKPGVARYTGIKRSGVRRAPSGTRGRPVRPRRSRAAPPQPEHGPNGPADPPRSPAPPPGRRGGRRRGP